MRFDLNVSPGGYAWWYIDALSDDGRYGLTLIAFIGSVFSPYYNRSGRRDPFDHCSVNVALYGGGKSRWAMCDTGRNRIEVRPDYFRVADTQLSFTGDALIIDIRETASPLPFPMRGRVRVEVPKICETEFRIDRDGRHRWRPIAPATRVSVDFTQPGLSWRGAGYFDMNCGDEKLEDGFVYWDWSRTVVSPSETAILYKTHPRNDPEQSLAVSIDADGTISPLEALDEARLPPTLIWRIPRRTRTASGGEVKVVKTLEDTPFYSRSVIRTRLKGQDRLAIHESLCGDRLRAPIVQRMIPYRMPRRS